MKAGTAVVIATLHLIGFYILLNFDASLLVTALVFFSIPIVLMLTLFVVLLDDSSDYPQLAKNDEFGYSDKKKDDLWIL
ncbi:MAG: hypothetical protein JSU01_12260 [Bacteroidetes bacterium]|nr:hypothetical protein [Bacteroidota bacterium]